MTRSAARSVLVVFLAGVLIAVEGIDGAGKTTQAKRLVRLLNRMGVKAAYTREPTGGSIGKLVRRHLSGRRTYSEETITLLFAADRLDHIQRFIEPQLKRGVTIVADRYVHSSIAYQAAATGMREWVISVNSLARRPDISIFVDVNPKEALARLGHRRKYVYERLEFLERVRGEYIRLVESGEMMIVDGSGTREEVAQRISTVVEPLLRERGLV